MKDFVYVISGEHGRQKIGCSDNPKQRLKELQTGSPYPLKFEFVGEAENRSAGQIEVEAHFTLNPHKSPGGDEWFTVPSDVAITAVMAAAHRLGYRLKPVDPDAISSPVAWPGARRWWDKAAQAAFILAVCYGTWESGVRLEATIMFGFILMIIINGAQRLAAMVERRR